MKSVNLAHKLPPATLSALYRYVEPGLLYLPARERRRDKTRKLPARDLAIRVARAAGASLEALAQKHHRSVARISEICRGIRVSRRQRGERA